MKKLDDTKILIDTDDKLPGDYSFENVVILMICVTKDDGTFYLQLFLEEDCFFNKHGNKILFSEKELSDINLDRLRKA